MEKNPRLLLVINGKEHRTAVICADKNELAARLAGPEPPPDDQAVFRAPVTAGDPGAIAFLFPGQGAQRPGMFAGLAPVSPEIAAAFRAADEALGDSLGRPLSSFIHPDPDAAGSPEAALRELTRTEVAQPALAAAGLGMARLLEACGIRPAMTAGHSAGEYPALAVAGVISGKDLFPLLAERGRAMARAAAAIDGTMAAVMAGPEPVREALAGHDDIFLANLNAPRQTVISGLRPAVGAALERLRSRRLRGREIPVAGPFHSPFMKPARDALAARLATCRFQAPARPVYANTSAERHHDHGPAWPTVLGDHLVQPVRFVEEIEAMYRDGARLFIETGPGAILTGLVEQILAGREFLAVAPGRAADGCEREGLRRALARLAAAGCIPSATPPALFTAVHRQDRRAGHPGGGQ